MNHQYRLGRACACLLLAFAGAHVHAQQTQAAAADPQAIVPPTRYQPILGGRLEAAPTSSPDANWVASNQAVAATNSMALTMKGMAGHGQAADPHAGHAGMQGMEMDKKDSPDMCKPGKGAGGMQCMSGAAAGKTTGEGKMSCCESGCKSGCAACCKDKMKKDKEAA